MNIKESPIKLRSLIKSNIWNLRQKLEEAFGTTDDKYIYLYQCKLSSIIKRDKQNKFESWRTRANLSLVLCKQLCKQDNNLKIPLLVIDINPRFAEEKKALFEEVAIKYIPLDSNSELDINSLLNCLPSENDRKINKLINTQRTSSENQTHTALNSQLKEYNFIYLSEVSLTEAIFIPEDERLRVRKRVEEFNGDPSNISDKVSKEVYDTLNYDGVVATKPPFSIPLFFIEVDGSIHRSKNNARRFKDQIKNGICERVTAPLIRIDVTNREDKDQYVIDIVNYISLHLAKIIQDSNYHYEFLVDEFYSHTQHIENAELADDIKRIFEYINTYYQRSNKNQMSYIDSIKANNVELSYEVEQFAESMYSQYNVNPEHELHDEYQHYSRVLNESPSNFYEWKHEVSKDDNGYRITLRGTLMDSVVIQGLKKNWEKSTGPHGIHVYGDNDYKNYINNLCVKFHNDQLQKHIKKDIDFFVRNRYEYLNSSLEDWYRSENRNLLKTVIFKRSSAQEKLKVIKTDLNNICAIRSNDKTTDQQAINKMEKRLQDRLEDIKLIISSDPALEEDEKDIIQLEVADHIKLRITNAEVKEAGWLLKKAPDQPESGRKS